MLGVHWPWKFYDNCISFCFTAGLLERPVIIESGKRREKKKVERLSMQETAPKETRKFEVGEGSGAKLGDCARSKSLRAQVQLG